MKHHLASILLVASIATPASAATLQVISGPPGQRAITIEAFGPVGQSFTAFDTTFSALDFLPIVLTGDVVTNGNAPFTPVSSTLMGLNIANGANFGFRWDDVNSTGNDHGVAIENLTTNARTANNNAVPEPGTWALMLVGFGIVGYSLRRSMQRTFSVA
jgi:PEP-CTERM motif